MQHCKIELSYDDVNTIMQCRKDEGEENLVKLFKPKICKQFEDMRNKLKKTIS